MNKFYIDYLKSIIIGLLILITTLLLSGIVIFITYNIVLTISNNLFIISLIFALIGVAYYIGKEIQKS